MTGRACFIYLTRCNSSQAHPRPFRAPDRSITVPYMRRSALEGLPAGNYRYVSQGHSRGCSQECKSEDGQVYSELLDG